MAGFTGFAVGHVSNKTFMIPLNEMNSGNYANRITVIICSYIISHRIYLGKDY